MRTSYKLISAIFAVALLAAPAAAQHLTEADGRQIIDGIEQVKAKAFANKDAAIWGSLLADNAAAEKWMAGVMKDLESVSNKVIEVKVMNDNTIVYTGAWSGVWHGDKGPIRLSGHYSDALAREQGGWKIVLDTGNSNQTPPQ
jgi:hypothetical protein